MDVSILIGVFFGLEGLFIGSFLNVVIDRLPFGKSLGGRSSCDNCGKRLSTIDLIPVFSYAWQRGKSRCCRKRLKTQYSLVEAATGLAFFVATTIFISHVKVLNVHSILALISLLIMVATSIAIAVIDFRHHIIPDELQIVLFIGVALYLLFTESFTVILVGQALIVALPILLLYLLTHGRGMGFADVKLQMTLGFWLGLIPGFLGMYIGFVAGALYGVSLMLLRKASRKSQIAFGPFLLLGAWTIFIWGDHITLFVKNLFRM